MPSNGPARAAAFALVAIAACLPPSAHGQSRTDRASGYAEIVGTVSAGVAFDIATRLLTSIFVTGRTGDTVSISAPGATNLQIPPAMLRDLALHSPGETASLEDITILSHGIVSINLKQIDSSASLTPDKQKSGMLVIIAQFN